MRTLFVGGLGVVLLLSGTVAGVAGTAMLVTNPCQPTYRLALQPADDVAEDPDHTVAVDDLSEVQFAAVRAAMENRTDVGFADRGALAELTAGAIAIDGDRYVARLVEIGCDTPYSDVAFVGYVVGLVGVFVTGYALILRRLS